MPIHNFYKPIGWSPLDVINKFKEMQPELADDPITYAGRLDPMAEGVLILLSGEERYEKESFQKMSKVYEATFLLGVESDTYDCLGLIKRGSASSEITKDRISSFLLGIHNLPFPPYSSYRVKGKPLHCWVKEGRLDEVKVPVKEMRVLGVEGVRIYNEDVEEIKKNVLDRASRVRGGFRQDEIIELWEDFDFDNDSVQLIGCTLTVTSGTYIRALAHEMGGEFGCGCALYSLKRVSVGDYMLSESAILV